MSDIRTDVCFLVFVLYEAEDVLRFLFTSAAGCAQVTLSALALISMQSSGHFSTQLSHPPLIPLHQHGSLTFADSLLLCAFSLCGLTLLIKAVIRSA